MASNRNGKNSLIYTIRTQRHTVSGDVHYGQDYLAGLRQTKTGVNVSLVMRWRWW